MKLLSFFVFIIMGLSSHGQKVNGTIVDESGLPISGVNIVASGSKKYFFSDFDGNFTIDVNTKDKLTFSSIGFITQTLEATNNMKVVMKEDVSQLQEIVVVGYGTKKAGAVTGSVVQIKSSEILKTPGQSAIQSIQGRAAGVNIVANDNPGSQPTVSIRGLGTVFGANQPLYVIDGIETSGLGGLSPNDIQTIDVLKDASSLAIYGQKGSNGVVLITTKKGVNGKMSINLETNFGLKYIQKKVKMANGDRYAYYSNYAQGSSSFMQPVQNVNTDWLSEITETGQQSNIALNISGGSENSNYYFGVANYKEKGILKGSEFERTNLNLKNEYKIFDNKVKIKNFVNFSFENNAPKPQSAFTSAYKQSPIMPVYNSLGRFAIPLLNNGVNDITGIRYNNVSNPVADLYFTNIHNRGMSILGSIGLEYDIYKDLKFNSNFGGTAFWNKGYSFYNNLDVFLHQNPSEQASGFTTPQRSNTLNVYKSEGYIWNWDNYLTYKKSFDNHTISTVVGMSRSTNRNEEYLNGTRYNVPLQNNYWNLDLSSNNEEVAPGNTVRSGHSTPEVSIAYFIRADYDYDNKYIFSTSFRREGMSNFRPDKRWDNFIAVSGGWVISNESFFKSSKYLNYLKIRGGYGEVGNGRGTPSVNYNLYANSNYSFNDIINPGSFIPRQTDPNLTWEIANEINFGIDFQMFNSNLVGSLDFYNKKSDRLILPVPYPQVISPEAVFVNAGTVNNRGVEFALNYKKTINDNWSYSIGGNIAYNKNELTESTNLFFKNLTGGSLNNGEFTKQVAVGQPLGSFYLYETQGFDSAGKFIYSAEKSFQGSYVPTITYGINLAINYKNIDFSTFVYGVGGNKIYNGKKAQRFANENIEDSLLTNFYTPSTPNALNPAPFNEVPLPSNYYLEDGSYLRINNITIGYTIKNVLKKVKDIRFYATAVNPFVFTNYSGFSPEIAGGVLSGAGIELDAYPTNKTFIAGFSVNF